MTVVIVEFILQSDLFTKVTRGFAANSRSSRLPRQVCPRPRFYLYACRLCSYCSRLCYFRRLCSSQSLSNRRRSSVSCAPLVAFASSSFAFDSFCFSFFPLLRLVAAFSLPNPSLIFPGSRVNHCRALHYTPTYKFGFVFHLFNTCLLSLLLHLIVMKFTTASASRRA